MEAMKNVLCNIWKTSSSMTIKEVGDKLYVFKFENQMEKEKEKVMMRQPLLVLQDFEKKIKLEEVKLKWCLF